MSKLNKSSEVVEFTEKLFTILYVDYGEFD
jgi:hypothetical protein